MLGLLFTHPAVFFLSLAGIALAIAIHEAAHSYAADYLGDPTPRALGRTTLNPLVHLDPVGTLMIILTGAFGWGKPSPYDPYNLRHPDRDTALIAAAGPASNLVLAGLFSIILRLSGASFISDLLVFLVALNVNLALFNLLPVPPLDGSKIFLKNRRISDSNAYLWLLLIILPLFGGRSLAALIISPLSSLLLGFLL